MPDNFSVTMDQLQIGLYVHLDLKWFEHPFMFSHFKIISEDQIKTIRGLGLKTVRYDPALSDIKPRPEAPPQQAEATAQPAAEVQVEIPPAVLAKRELIERVSQLRKDQLRVEHAFINTAKTIRDIERDIFTKPVETVQKVSQTVGQMAKSLFSAPELSIHLMVDKVGGEELYFHSLNVTMLSMMVARDIKMPQDLVAVMGVGALLHDIGRKEIPSRILMQMEPLNQAERRLYERHCQYGVEIGQKLELAPAALAIIREHHEMFDGSGYPAKLKGEAIGLLPRIVAIANFYDELCNPLNIANAVKPHEALSMMFVKLRSKFDPKLLQIFVRCLGIYPPGTIVQLSNGVIGLVATVNSSQPMKPTVTVYDKDIPSDEPLLLDLEQEPDVTIEKALKLAQVPKEVISYLRPGKQISYYFDPGSAKQKGG